MSKIFKRVIIVLILMLISFNAIFPNSSYANDIGDDSDYGITIGLIGDYFVGFVGYIPKLVLLVPGLLANTVLTMITSIGTNNISDLEFVTLDMILFNKLPLIDINIFSDYTAPDRNGDIVEVSELIKTIRGNVLGWYYAFRNLAIVVALLILIYTGIRMAIESIGSNGKAEKLVKYKQMIMDWVVCIALLFFLHFIIIIVLNVNTLAVNMLSPNSENGGKEYTSFLLSMAFDIQFVRSWGAAIVYSIFGIISFAFLTIYIKRMLMTCFLILISPIAVISYSLDKVGKRRSSILIDWMKEFGYNVLIQPFHCVTYIVFASTTINTLYANSRTFDLKKITIAITCTICIFMGEKIVRTIFGFNKSKSVASKIFTASMITSVISNVKQIKQAAASEEAEEGGEDAPDVMPDGTSTQAFAESNSRRVALKNTDESDDSTQGIRLGNMVGERNYQRNDGNDTSTQGSSGTSDNSSSSGNSRSSRKPGTPGTQTMPLSPENSETPRNPATQGAPAPQSTNTENQNNQTNASQITENGQSKAKKDAKQNKTKNKGDYSYEELFVLAANSYRQEVNPNMTNEQLAKRTDIIRKTSMEDLMATRNVTDIRYKTWIDKMEKRLKNKGVEHPEEIIARLIEDSKIM